MMRRDSDRYPPVSLWSGRVNERSTARMKGSYRDTATNPEDRAGIASFRQTIASGAMYP